MSSFETNNGISIQKAFERFDTANPKVYEIYERMIKLAVAKGKKKISSKMVLNVIRWEIYIDTKDESGFVDGDGEKHVFRINDAYTSRYARKFVTQYPEYVDLFNFKHLRAI